jgi:hypothetical protein
MTALNRTPQNTNLLQASKFLLTFDRIPNSQYFCQSANVPGLSIGQASINSPLLDYFAPGNKITYNPFNITFLVNGDAQSWKDLHDWFRSIASPESFDERNRLSNIQSNRKNLKSYSDATLTLLSNLNNPILRIYFYNMFPITLSDIMLDTKMSADDVLTSDASFMFEYFNIEAA